MFPPEALTPQARGKSVLVLVGLVLFMSAPQSEASGCVDTPELLYKDWEDLGEAHEKGVKAVKG